MKMNKNYIIVFLIIIRILLLIIGDSSFALCGDNNGGMSPIGFVIYIGCCFVAGALFGTYIKKRREAKELEAALTAQKEISAKEELLKNEELLKLELENQINDNQIWDFFGSC